LNWLHASLHPIHMRSLLLGANYRGSHWSGISCTRHLEERWRIHHRVYVRLMIPWCISAVEMRRLQTFRTYPGEEEADARVATNITDRVCMYEKIHSMLRIHH
jgi:hypothetical protein